MDGWWVRKAQMLLTHIWKKSHQKVPNQHNILGGAGGGGGAVLAHFSLADKFKWEVLRRDWHLCHPDKAANWAARRATLPYFTSGCSPVSHSSLTDMITWRWLCPLITFSDKVNICPPPVFQARRVNSFQARHNGTSVTHALRWWWWWWWCYGPVGVKTFMVDLVHGSLQPPWRGWREFHVLDWRGIIVPYLLLCANTSISRLLIQLFEEDVHLSVCF